MIQDGKLGGYEITIGQVKNLYEILEGPGYLYRFAVIRLLKDLKAYTSYPPDFR